MRATWTSLLFLQAKFQQMVDSSEVTFTLRYVQEDSDPMFTAVGNWNLTWITYEIWQGKFYRIYHQHSMGYRQNNRGIVVRLQALVRNCSVLQRVQTGSMAYPASYSMGRGGSFPGVKRTVHFHLVPRLRNTGALLPLPRMSSCSRQKLYVCYFNCS